MKDRITIGSRGSKLALIQAEFVANGIRRLFPKSEVTICKIVTQGDRNPTVQLDHMERVGVFVKELEEALLDGRIDLAVHSLKDVPTETPAGLRLAACPERADPGDVLVSRHGKLADMPQGAKLGTGSLRRSVQILNLRPDLQVCGIRGNVDTRLRKVASGEIDGVILAAAAMKRLGWEDRISDRLPVERFLPAVGQGALVIETRDNDQGTVDVICGLNHMPTLQSVTAERAFLSALGGGCRAPIAALGTVADDVLELDGMVASVSTRHILRATEIGSPEDAEKIGARLAQRLLAMGAADFIAEANCERR
ncbi:MAG: hydroxymethylbilane synthase [Dehalococcoidia bacterium]|nr:hydroxymethylbilane synthase [Dehalococcoidia bacterium]